MSLKPKPDVNYLSYADRSNVIIQNQVISPENTGKKSKDFDDILKFSNVKGGLVERVEIILLTKPKEDAIDLNRYCENIIFKKITVDGGVKYVFTIKGGTRGTELNDVVITRPGKYVDIDIGNYSHVSDAKTHDTKLINVRRADGKPVRVRVGYAGNPKIQGGNCKILFWQSLFLVIYVWVTRLLRKLFKK